MTRYWVGGGGGHKNFLLLTLYNFKNIVGGGGGHEPLWGSSSKFNKLSNLNSLSTISDIRCYCTWLSKLKLVFLS